MNCAWGLPFAINGQPVASLAKGPNLAWQLFFDIEKNM
jgi:hypothetical protein